MKIKILYIFIAFLLLHSPVKSQTMTIGYFLLEPHSGFKNDMHFGAAIDLWQNHVAKEMKVKIRFAGPMPLPRLIRETVAGRINVITLVAKTEERSKILEYPEAPFAKINSCIALMKQNRIRKLSKAEDLKGLTLGFFAGGYIHPKLKNIKILWSNTYNTDWIKVNLKILKFGRIDGIYDPDISSLKYYIKKNNMESLIRVVKIPDAKTQLFSVFSIKDKGFFRKKYEKALPSVLKRISYKGLLEKYMNL